MKNTFYKLGLLAVVLQLMVLPLLGFSMIQLDTTQPLDSRILGFSNTLANPIIVKTINLKLRLNGAQKQTFYDVIPSKYLKGYQYSLEFDQDLPIKLDLVRDNKSNKINLEVLQSGDVIINSKEVKIKIKIIT